MPRNLLKLFEDKQISFFPLYLMDLAATSSVKKLLGANVKLVVNFYDGTNLKMYADRDSWIKVCDIAQRELINSDNFYRRVKVGMLKRCQGLEDFSNQLLKINPKVLTNKQLVNYYKKFEEITVDLRAYAWIPNMVDLGSMSIFDVAEKEIEKKIGDNDKIKEYLSKLTTPVEMTQQRRHELDLYMIQYLIQAKKIKNWQKDKAINKMIDKHLHDYGWLSYYYIGPSWSKKDIVDILKHNITLIKNPKEKINEIANYAKQIKADKEKIYKIIGVGTQIRSLLEKIATMMFLKSYRKEFLIYSNYCFEPILQEIAHRLGLSLSEVRFLTRDEIKRYLIGKLMTASIRQQFKKRLSAGCVSIIQGQNVKILDASQKKKYMRFLVEEAPQQSDIIKGNCAFPGIARGIVRVINLRSEVNKIKKGEILVSRATNPDLVTAMQRSSAIVTDEGGITCHAAIVSREMKKPCIIGTKVASKILKDGDLIEVDAGKGLVNIIKKH